MGLGWSSRTKSGRWPVKCTNMVVIRMVLCPYIQNIDRSSWHLAIVFVAGKHMHGADTSFQARSAGAEAESWQWIPWWAQADAASDTDPRTHGQRCYERGMIAVAASSNSGGGSSRRRAEEQLPPLPKPPLSPSPKKRRDAKWDSSGPQTTQCLFRALGSFVNWRLLLQQWPTAWMSQAASRHSLSRFALRESGRKSLRSFLPSLRHRNSDRNC